MDDHKQISNYIFDSHKQRQAKIFQIFLSPKKIFLD